MAKMRLSGSLKEPVKENPPGGASSPAKMDELQAGGLTPAPAVSKPAAGPQPPATETSLLIKSPIVPAAAKAEPNAGEKFSEATSPLAPTPPAIDPKPVVEKKTIAEAKPVAGTKAAAEPKPAEAPLAGVELKSASSPAALPGIPKPAPAAVRSAKRKQLQPPAAPLQPSRFPKKKFSKKFPS